MLANAEDALFPSIAEALRPPPRIPLSQWAEENRVLPSEVSGHSGRWSNDLFPFLADIMDCLCPWHPAETVTFCKSAQTGGTESSLNWMFAIADMWAAPTMMVHPTIQAAQAWVREKLSHSIRATPPMRRKLLGKKLKDSSSTTLFKSFDGGYWVITGANSSADISSKSVRYVVKEEWDRWPIDVEGQGDPDQLVKARQTSYHASGKAKTYQASTPTILGISRIWPAYLEGDQRKFYVPCPHCEEEQTLHFFPDENKLGGLHFNKEAPYEAHYICKHCGSVINHFHKQDMLARGRWIAENPGVGKQPSFFINALYSPVTTWDKMAEEFIKSKDDPRKFKAFINLWLGEPWEERGEAPEWQRLFARREIYEFRRVPPGGLIVTGAADIQSYGIYYEIIAWGVDKQSWSIDYGFLEGDTADENNTVWRKLDEIYSRKYQDSFGNAREIDAFAVDAGYNTGAVYAWARRLPKAYAVKGRSGWFHPPIGSPTQQEVDYRGKKLRRGLLLWPIGTWPLKAELYANLRKEGKRDGAEFDPPGFCHFSEFHDEGFFKQLTDEHLKEREVKGRMEKEWVSSGNNHYHDCRIYNMAMAEHLGISTLTAEEWRKLAKQRNQPVPDIQGDLLSSLTALPVQTEPTSKKSTAKKDWIGGRADNWLD